MSLTVPSTDTLLDEPVDVSVNGVRPGAAVELYVSSTDANGVRWRSRSEFNVDADGALRSPDDGPQDDADALSAVWAMRPARTADDGTFYDWGGRPQRFQLTLHAPGEGVATATLTRSAVGDDVVTRSATSARDGFVGTLWTTAGEDGGGRPAVLLIGGSEGGAANSATASMLASRGVPALSIAYFGAPGLPDELADISLEYFATALRWLGRQPGADADRIWVIGWSRGSEAAQLVSVVFPNLVHGVVAAVPSNVALCGIPRCLGPAWTLDDRFIPFTQQFNTVAPTDRPAAVIPVERHDGPLLAICGGRDAVWNSCAYAHAIVQRRMQSNQGDWTELLEYDDAGHFIGALVPNDILVPPRQVSGKRAENERALRDIWPSLLDTITTDDG